MIVMPAYHLFQLLFTIFTERRLINKTFISVSSWPHKWNLSPSNNTTVSYKHLDVYKRQLLPCPEGRGILSGSDLMVDLPAMIDSYTLQPSIPSDGGTVTTASPRHS